MSLTGIFLLPELRTGAATLKTAFLWRGRQVALGFGLLGTALKAVAAKVVVAWGVSASFRAFALSFFRSGFGVGGLLVLLGAGALSLAEMYPGEENRLARFAIYGMAIAIIFTAGALMVAYGANPLI